MIGGEFDIAVTDIQNTDGQPLACLDIYSYSSGRAALYQILNYLKNEKAVKHILLPDYLCSSVLIPVKALNLKFTFYQIDDNLELIKESFVKSYFAGTAILIINYYGLKNLDNQVKAIREVDENAIIIEDDVQAYYEFMKPLINVDFKFTSLRKTFAIPDGGLVKTKFHLPIVDKPNTFGQYKYAAALLKSMREGNFNDNIYLELFEKGEDLIDVELECGMSHIANKLYSSVFEEHVKYMRINNANYLIKELEKIGVTPILSLNEDHVPLFIPIALENRDKVRNAMFKEQIFCPVHWPLEGLNIRRGKILAEKELSLIIDQRYGLEEMNNIITVLKKSL